MSKQKMVGAIVAVIALAAVAGLMVTRVGDVGIPTPAGYAKTGQQVSGEQTIITLTRAGSIYQASVDFKTEMTRAGWQLQSEDSSGSLAHQYYVNGGKSAVVQFSQVGEEVTVLIAVR